MTDQVAAEDIRAKRIEWEGVVYDSQLEADWAATLRGLGVAYTYHPGRLTLPEGGWWEPDFLLTGWDDLGQDQVIAEVKGPHNNRLWKAESVARNYGKPVLILRTGLVLAASDNETAGACWHGVTVTGLEWVLEYDAAGLMRFTQEPEAGDEWLRVSAERCISRPEVSGVGMRKALGRQVGWSS